jgi:hypothetical protein
LSDPRNNALQRASRTNLGRSQLETEGNTIGQAEKLFHVLAVSRCYLEARIVPAGILLEHFLGIIRFEGINGPYLLTGYMQRNLRSGEDSQAAATLE